MRQNRLNGLDALALIWILLLPRQGQPCLFRIHVLSDQRSIQRYVRLEQF